ncbi:MAG: transcription-repair coupling factor (superfamily II helicase) [Chloroflexi bacterium]|nr:MAG: transcription-repair coupling factor (superfamily II helicase) [Chloroflexota bacterium]
MDLSYFINYLSNSTSIEEFLKKNINCTIGVSDNAKPLTYATIQKINKNNLIIITASDLTAKNTFEQLKFYSKKKIIYFEPHNHFQVEGSNWSRTIELLRLKALSNIFLINDLNYVIVMSVNAALQKTTAYKDFAEKSFVLKLGDQQEINELVNQLVNIGYDSADIVIQAGEFVRRGGIVDIYPVNSDNPIRIEFETQNINSIRSFNSDSQRTIAILDSVIINPAREWPKNEDISEHKNTKFSQNTILNYLKKDSTIVLDELNEVMNTAKDNEDFFDKAKNNLIKSNKKSKENIEPNIKLLEFKKRIKLFNNQINIDRWAVDGKKKIRIPIVDQVIFSSSLEQSLERISSMTLKKDLILIVSQQAQRISEIINKNELSTTVTNKMNHDIEKVRIQILQGSLTNGFIITNDNRDIHLITDNELFGYQLEKRSIDNPKIKQLNFIKEGDFIVHRDYGIARYIGIIKKEVANKNEEYLHLQYADEDKIYLPILQISKITKYIASSNYIPKLSKLNSSRWLNTKKKVSESINILAAELISIYSARKELKGYAFSKDNDWQKQLESGFQYEETSDQKKAIFEVKKDMESQLPMDRLICGDVGFGKTEVALRAAFKAIQDGFQVAVLVPTTVLAEQHLRTFKQRLAAFPVNIESISRFKQKKEIDSIIKKLKKNQIDILIGTHKILSKNIKFKKLGLIVIDEEQKFGVIHKEKLKKIKLHVDTLIMSATPIPRTMYMGISGIRDLSMIESAPKGRMSIKTIVSEYSANLIKQAITNEINRNGQIYFVHNKVMTIESTALELKKLIPAARIKIAHGQMNEKKLEEVMELFAKKEFDLLVCTTIIESGIDNPNVNTIIVDNADMLGLSQLYQLRGRIGRGVNQGHAYLFYKQDIKLSNVARKRLSTIFDASKLGSGFQVALKDLEIRGAGNLLGSEQSGHISSIGLELYTEMLSESVKKEKTNTKISYDSDNFFTQINIDSKLRSYIPDSYIKKNEIKLEFYRKLSYCNNDEHLTKLHNEIKDRFGTPPEEINNLFESCSINIAAKKANIESISLKNNLLSISTKKTLLWNAIEKKYGKDIIQRGTKKIGIYFNYDNQNKLKKIKEIIEEIIN